MKKRLPSLKLELPENLIICPECRGKGKTKPMFHELTCMNCNGFGKLDGDTGEAIPWHVLIPALMTTINHLRAELQLRKNSDNQAEFNPYNGSGYYKGD